MIRFQPYYPHDPSTSDTTFEAKQEAIDKGLKKLYKAIDRAELNLLICDIMISQEKPTQEVISGFADKIERIFNEK